MTHCKELPDEIKLGKATTFKVEIDITTYTDSCFPVNTVRDEIVKDLRKCGWCFTENLANIIEEG